MSLKTDNFKLYKYEDNDIGDLRFINNSMDIIDKGINPFYVATQSSTNVYKITTGLNKTVLNDGYSIKIAIPSNSTGAVSVTVDSVTAPVKKPNGGAVTNFKANGVYSLTYYNSVFILTSGAGGDTVNFTSDKLLTGYSANDSNGEKVNGTMPNKGTSTNTLGLNGSLTLPSGYYDSIKVTQSITTRGSTTDAISQGTNGNYIYTRIPQGAYFTNASTGYPEIKSKFSDIAKAIGLTADKLVGNVGGINGTAVKMATGTVKSSNSKDTQFQLYQLGGTKVNRATLKVSGLSFKPKYAIFYSVTNIYGTNEICIIDAVNKVDNRTGVLLTGYYSGSSCYSINCPLDKNTFIVTSNGVVGASYSTNTDFNYIIFG